MSKDHGVLAFSFHHSREDGWAAIYEAIVSAGLEVVAAHPVHAEMRAASPKSAAKDPISLDAILVCRKHLSSDAKMHNLKEIVARTEEYVRRLTSAGLSISSADRFVIAAFQALISASAQELPVAKIKARLEAVRRDVESTLVPPQASTH